MTFTQDELEAFTTILGQKLAEQNRELSIEIERCQLETRRDVEQRIATLVLGMKEELAEQRRMLEEALEPKLEKQQRTLAQAVQREFAEAHQQQQYQLQGVLENTLAAQLLGIELLISQRLPSVDGEAALALLSEPRPDFSDIELQTEIPWEELISAVDKVLDERMSTLYKSLVVAFKNTERSLLEQLHHLRKNLVLPGQPVDTQELLSGMEQLERMVESTQVAMTANHSLLSNRLYHHLHLPLERAHPLSRTGNSLSAQDIPANPLPSSHEEY